MESKTLTLPIKQDDGYGYRLAFRLAREDLARIDDIEAQCRKSGAQHLAPEKAIAIRYLHQEYLISLTSGDVSLRGQDEEVLLLEKILLLHYFTRAKGTPAKVPAISPPFTSAPSSPWSPISAVPRNGCWRWPGAWAERKPIMAISPYPSAP
jgi:hypothetical protein